MFPVPVRPSAFRASAAVWEPYNVEVALDLIPAFAFDGATPAGPWLLYDLQTGLEGNWPGRLGAGRSGVYRGCYIKGVGRTPAAANWHVGEDRYHGSGHLSVGSALRERLVTLLLRAHGLGDTVVGCDAVLLRRLKRAERRAIAQGATSAVAEFAPADAEMSALTVKQADFARPANIVYALDHFAFEPRGLGLVFLEFERFLRRPSDRATIEGAPADIARSLAGAFEAGLETFEAFARIGLHWMFLAANVTLDGRFLDLETPTFFGAPFVGMRVTGETRRVLLGFEELSFARYWRFFLTWLRARLEYLRAPALLREAASRRFIDELARQLDVVFEPRHLVYDDEGLQRRALANLEPVLDLGPRGRAALRELASYAARGRLRGVQEDIPRVGWREVESRPAPATPTPARYEAPAFLEPRLTADAEGFAAGLARLGAEQDLDTLLRTLSRYRTPGLARAR